MSRSASVEKRVLNQDSRARSVLFLAVGAGFFAGALFVVQAILLSGVVNRVFRLNQTLGDVLPLLGVMLALLLLRSGLIWAQEVLAQRSASRIKGSLRQQLTAHFYALGPAYTRSERSGDLVNAAVEGIETLDEYVTQFLPARYLAGLAPVFVLVVVFLLDPWTTLVLLFAGPMLILLLALIGSRAKAITERRFLELSWMSAFFLDVLQGIATLKMFGRSREQAATIEEISSHYGKTTMEVLATAFQTSLMMEWAATAATAMVALEVSLRLMNGVLPFERALAVLLLTPEFFLPLRQLAIKYHSGTTGKAAAQRIYAILDTPVARGRSQVAGGKGEMISQPVNLPAHQATTNLKTPLGHCEEAADEAISRCATPRLLRRRPPRNDVFIDGCAPSAWASDLKMPGQVQDSSTCRGVFIDGCAPSAWASDLSSLRFDVLFDDVKFSYPGRGSESTDGENAWPALQGFSMAIPHGQTVALVGATGAGKTTVASLLLRFVDPDAGRIAVGGVSLQEIDRAVWRRAVAWVPQSPHLFHGTVADNIRLARPEAGMDAVIAASQAAHADEFIRALPQGYDTPLGERGARLSGGQRQRLAIARAFLKDAPVLILDEATANLDSKSEALIRDALHRLMAGRTALIIAHRLELAYSADHIVVMDAGRAVETGTHTDLLARDGLYRHLVASYESTR